MSSIDRQWFKKHREANFRIRREAPGELVDIFRHSVKGSGYDLALSGLPDLGDDLEWRVCVVNVAPDTLMRFPTSRPKGSPDELGPDGLGGTGIAVVFGNRFILDKIAG